jgi:hypothetical protein
MPLNMPHYLLKYFSKMSKTIQKQKINVEKSLYHHGLIQIIVKSELQKQELNGINFLLKMVLKNRRITKVSTDNALQDTTWIKTNDILNPTMDDTE